MRSKSTYKGRRISSRKKAVKVKKLVEPGMGIVFAKTLNGIYLPDCLPQVRAIAMRGYTDDEISTLFGVDKDLFQKWKKVYPDFREAIDNGRTFADIAVVESLFKRAVGYDYHEQGLTRTGSVRELRKHLPGDVGAIKYWLNNREKEHWKERTSTELGGSSEKGAKPISVKSEGREMMIAAILSLVTPKPDNAPEKKS